MTSREELRSAIDGALSGLGDFPNGWVLVYEGVASDGERTLVHEISEDLADWTRVGMLYSALEMGTWLYDDDHNDPE